MRIVSLTLIINTVLIFACTDSKKEKFDIDLLPKNWIQLTEKSGKLVVYNSCDMGNSLLTITKNKEHFELLLHGTQEDYDFEIIDVKHYLDTVFIRAKWKENNESQLFKFFWTDKQNGLGRWITTYSNGFTSNNKFVVSEKQTNFKTINQPCKECWDECDEK